MSGIEKGSRETRSVICVYDKRSRRAEVGTPMDLRNAKDALADFPVGSRAAPAGTAATLIYPGSATCGRDCLAHWTALSRRDQSQLVGLPEQVRRTLAEAKPAAEPAPAAAGQLDAGIAPDLSRIVPGNRTLYRFGFTGEFSRQVGTYGCRVDRLPDST